MIAIPRAKYIKHDVSIPTTEVPCNITGEEKVWNGTSNDSTYTVTISTIQPQVAQIEETSYPVVSSSCKIYLC